MQKEEGYIPYSKDDAKFFWINALGVFKKYPIKQVLYIEYVAKGFGDKDQPGQKNCTVFEDLHRVHQEKV
ncbi:MAG TPA: hypothetical protein ENN39_06600 [Desulfonatronum sp.]|nr:hypothetical protein [Desulfonatronum sp.]